MQGRLEKTKRRSKNTHNCNRGAEPVYALNEPTLHEQGKKSKGKQKKENKINSEKAKDAYMYL